MAYTFTHGIALGLWILAGLAFFVAAVLPGSAVGQLAGPLLLAITVGWTAVMVRHAEWIKSFTPDLLTSSKRPRVYALTLIGVLVALAITVTIIRSGDQRSFLLAAFAACCALVLGWQAAGNHYRDRK